MITLPSPPPSIVQLSDNHPPCSKPTTMLYRTSRAVTVEEALKVAEHQYGSPLQLVSLSRLDVYGFR